MNAAKLLAKYERLAEIAHLCGAYKCARKWSLKVEKLEAVISALRQVEEPKEEPKTMTPTEIRAEIEKIRAEQDAKYPSVPAYDPDCEKWQEWLSYDERANALHKQLRQLIKK